MTHINNNSKPLIFLGSSNVMYDLIEICEQLDIKISGIVDQDYWGNTEHICDIPVIDSEACFEDVEKLEFYKKNYHFFCAVNWTPENNEIAIRNRKKRIHVLSIIDKYQLPCISLVNPTAVVSKYASIGHGVLIDSLAILAAKSSVGDFSNIYLAAKIGHEASIDRNCVIQRECFITDGCQIEHDSYFGLCSKALKVGARFGAGTFVHEAVYIRRGTVKNEIVSMDGVNMKRVVPYPIVI
jgi:hypothetical protein